MRDVDAREAAYRALREIVRQSGYSDADVETWLRTALHDEPDWLRDMVLDNFGYSSRHPGLPPRGPEVIIRRG